MAEQGNNAAMREALLAVKKSLDDIGASSLDGDPEIRLMSLTQVCARLSSRVESALSKAARNCDVGTADEQEERFKHYCGQHYTACNVDAECFRCPLSSEKTSCEFAWVQMPYEEGGNHA